MNARWSTVGQLHSIILAKKNQRFKNRPFCQAFSLFRRAGAVVNWGYMGIMHEYFHEKPLKSQGLGWQTVPIKNKIFQISKKMEPNDAFNGTVKNHRCSENVDCFFAFATFISFSFVSH